MNSKTDQKVHYIENKMCGTNFALDQELRKSAPFAIWGVPTGQVSRLTQYLFLCSLSVQATELKMIHWAAIG